MSAEVVFRPACELRHFVKRPDGESLGILGESDRDNPSVGVGEAVKGPHVRQSPTPTAVNPMLSSFRRVALMLPPSKK